MTVREMIDTLQEIACKYGYKLSIEERVSQFENKYGFGMNRDQYWQFVDLHRTGSDDDKRFVEALFTDLNYHTECKLLKQEDYVAAHHLWETD